MTPDKGNCPMQRLRLVTPREIAWRRAGKIYVLLHGVVTIGPAVLGLVFSSGERIPAVVGGPVFWIASLGLIPFLLSSPIVAFVMLFILSRRNREWLYLGICDVALLSLHVFEVFLTCL